MSAFQFVSSVLRRGPLARKGLIAAHHNRIKVVNGQAGGHSLDDIFEALCNLYTLGDIVGWDGEDAGWEDNGEIIIFPKVA